MNEEVVKIIIVMDRGTDGFKLVVEYPASQKELAGWFAAQEYAAHAAREWGDDVEIIGLPADQGGKDMWAAEEWLYDVAREDVNADTTDEELAALARRYEANAQDENVELIGDVLEFLREVRGDKLQEEEQ